MPWTSKDSLKHKKDLNEKQQKLWAKVANSALERCKAKDGRDCEGSAIRQANSVVERQMSYGDWVKEYTVVQTFNLNGIEIFSEGTWNGDKYTTDDLDNMVTAFNAIGFKPPLKIGHNETQPEIQDGQPAIGWIDKIYKQGSKLLADFKELPLKVYEALKRGNYKQVSSEIYWNYTGQNDIAYPRVLKAVALLGADIPAVTNLESISNLYTNDPTFDELKLCTELEVAEKKINQEVKKMAEIEDIKKEKDELETQVKNLRQKISEKEQTETELAELRAKVKADQVKLFIKEGKDAGRIIPAFENELESLLLSANNEKVHKFSENDKEVELSQRELVERIFSKMPKIVELSEIAGDGNGDEPFTGESYHEASVEIDKRVKTYMEKNNSASYQDAVKFVLSKDEKLKEVYVGR